MHAQPATDRIAPTDRPMPGADRGATRVDAATKFSSRLANLSAQAAKNAAPAGAPAGESGSTAGKTDESKNLQAPAMSGKQIEILTKQHKELRDAASQLVGMTFYAPMLQMSRDSTFKSELFHGGAGEDAFASHLDTILTERLSAARRHPLADTVYRYLARNMPADPAAPVQERKASDLKYDPNRKTPNGVDWRATGAGASSMRGVQGVVHA